MPETQITEPTNPPAMPPGNDSILGGSDTSQAPDLAQEQPEQEQQEQPQPAALPATPDGYKVEFAPETQVDQELLGLAQAWALENKLPPEGFSKLAKDYEALVAKRGQAALEAQNKALQAQEEAWRGQVSADSIFAPANKDASIAAITRFKAEFMPEENHPLRQLFNDSGLGSHPEMVKLAVAIGKKLAEPSFVSGNDSPVSNKSLAETLYPNQSKI
jgi:hypothetical protein